MRPDENAPPWTWNWFCWRSGEGWTLFWICLIHVFALVGVIVFPVPGWPVFLAAYLLSSLGGLGTTVCYHRALAHRSVRLNKAVEFCLTVLAIFNGSGSPATWTANHRLHHANADTDEDISSPRIGGFWWSHLRWLWQAVQGSVPRWAPDLNRRYYAFWTRWQILILALSFGVGIPFGWKTFFWLGAIRLTFSLHGQCLVNSVAHMRKGAKRAEDSSQNLPWLSVIHSFQGESWHGNHHTQPHSARLGWNWRQFDIGWWVIVVLEKFGLANRVRRPQLPWDPHGPRTNDLHRTRFVRKRARFHTEWAP